MPTVSVSWLPRYSSGGVQHHLVVSLVDQQQWLGADNYPSRNLWLCIINTNSVGSLGHQSQVVAKYNLVRHSCGSEAVVSYLKFV